MSRKSFVVHIPNHYFKKDDKWQVIFKRLPRGIDGECDISNKRIYINSRLRKPKTIRAALTHEIIHASCWHLSEDSVIDMERSIMEGLDKLAQ